MARRCPEGGIAYASVAAVVAAQAWRRRGHGVADVRALANPAATAAVFTAARGYSLIEVLGAATLLIVGLAGLTSGLSTLREADARADRLAASAAIAATWIDRTQRAEAGTPLSSSSCIAAELACTPVAGGAHRTCFVDDAGEPAADGAFTIGWTILAEVPRAGTRQVRLVVVDRAGLSSPFEVVTHVR